MAQKWLVWLRDAGGQRLQWASWDGQHLASAGEGDLEAACAALSGQAVALVLPGSTVTLHRARLPAAGRSRLRAAAPYALEDALAEDVEDLHFAVGERDAEGRVAVAVVGRDWLRGLLDRLAAGGVQVSRVAPDFLLLPEPDQGLTVLLEAQWAIVRGTGADGYAVESDLLPDLLEAGTDAAPPVRVYRVGAAAADLPAAAETVQRDSALAVFAGELGRLPLDLLQGEFSPGEALGRSLRRWRTSGVLAALLLAVWVGSTLLSVNRLETQSAALQAQVETVLRETFPEVRRVVNARAQMTQRLRALRGQQTTEAGFLDLLAEVGEALAGDTDLTLTAISYRRGRLDLEFDAKQIASLYRLQQKLAERSALEVSVQSANSEQGKAEGRLRVEARRG